MNRKKLEKPELAVTNYDLSPFMPHNSVMTKSSSFENESVEALREKLVIKSEALNMLGKQLELCNKEKNEYKRLIDTLYDKNLSLKKMLYFQQQSQVDPEDENNFLHMTGSGSLFSGGSPGTNTGKSSNNAAKSHHFLLRATPKSKKTTNTLDTGSTSCLFNDIDSEDYMKILKDLIKTLQKEKTDVIQKYEEVQQELNDSRNDLRLLREQIVRQRVGSYIEGLNTSTPIKLDINAIDLSAYEHMKKQQQQQPTTMSSSQSVASALSTANANSMRESLIKEIEQLREQKNTIENDLRLALCQKEEIEIERDSYKEKYLKLNKFLLDTSRDDTAAAASDPDMNNNSKQVDRSRLSLCVDELISKNKYLTESNRNLKEELEMLKVSSKKQSKGPSPPVQPAAPLSPQLRSELLSAETGNINKQKVKLVLFKADQFLSEVDPDEPVMRLVEELKSTVEALIEALNDKLIANAHQRKVNKMLAERIQDLERQISKLAHLGTSGSFEQQSPASSTSLSQHLGLDEPLIPVKSSFEAKKF